MKMNSKKVFYVMSAVVALLALAAIGSMFLVNKQFEQSTQSLIEAKLENRLLEEQQTALIRVQRDMDTYNELEQIAKTVVPQEKDQARTVREIINLANAAGVRIGSVTFPSSTLGQGAVQTTPSDGATSGSTTPAAPPVTQVKPVEGIPGVYQLEVTVLSDASRPATYSQFIDFLERLEMNRRTAQVTSVTVQPSSVGSNTVTFSLVINVYIKP